MFFYIFSMCLYLCTCFCCVCMWFSQLTLGLLELERKASWQDIVCHTVLTNGILWNPFTYQIDLEVMESGWTYCKPQKPCWILNLAVPTIYRTLYAYSKYIFLKGTSSQLLAPQPKLDQQCCCDLLAKIPSLVLCQSCWCSWGRPWNAVTGSAQGFGFKLCSHPGRDFDDIWDHFL